MKEKIEKQIAEYKKQFEQVQANALQGPNQVPVGGPEATMKEAIAAAETEEGANQIYNDYVG